MKRALLTVALFVTACNLAAGIAYAAHCSGKGGQRLCGATCNPQPDGGCWCEGACSADDIKWMGGGAAALEEVEDDMY